MGKTRSCRRSEDENKARSEGFNQGKKAAPEIDTDKILEKIGTIKGIGAVKLQEIKGILEQCK